MEASGDNKIRTDDDTENISLTSQQSSEDSEETSSSSDILLKRGKFVTKTYELKSHGKRAQLPRKRKLYLQRNRLW